MRKCPYCNALLLDWDRTCYMCRRPLPTGEETAAQDSTEAPSASQPPQTLRPEAETASPAAVQSPAEEAAVPFPRPMPAPVETEASAAAQSPAEDAAPFPRPMPAPAETASPADVRAENAAPVPAAGALSDVERLNKKLADAANNAERERMIAEWPAPDTGDGCVEMAAEALNGIRKPRRSTEDGGNGSEQKAWYSLLRRCNARARELNAGSDVYRAIERYIQEADKLLPSEPTQARREQPKKRGAQTQKETTPKGCLVFLFLGLLFIYFLLSVRK